MRHHRTSQARAECPQPHDIDNPAGPREPITFPYWPERAQVADPVITMETK